MCERCEVRGRVQGVGFRWATRDRASALGLRGSVRNLADGGVEVIACGPDASRERLREWLRQGPSLAGSGAQQGAPVSSIRPFELVAPGQP